MVDQCPIALGLANVCVSHLTGCLRKEVQQSDSHIVRLGRTHETALDVLLANLDQIAPVAQKVYPARSPDERGVVTTSDF